MKDRPADEQIMVWVDELIAEAEAERDPEEVAEHPPIICHLQLNPISSMGSYVLAEGCAQPIFAETVALKRLQDKAFAA